MGVKHGQGDTTKRPRILDRFKLEAFPNVRWYKGRPHSVHCAYYSAGLMRMTQHSETWVPSDIDATNDERKIAAIKRCQQFYNDNHDPPLPLDHEASENPDADLAAGDLPHD